MSDEQKKPASDEPLFRGIKSGCSWKLSFLGEFDEGTILRIWLGNGEVTDTAGQRICYTPDLHRLILTIARLETGLAAEESLADAAETCAWMWTGGGYVRGCDPDGVDVEADGELNFNYYRFCHHCGKRIEEADDD